MTTDAGAEPGPDRPAGIPVGRLIGVPVYLKPSWLLVAAVITVVFAPRIPDPVRPPAAVYAIAFGFAVLLLLSVLAHELAHAVAARATGTPATHITLDVWGGHTGFAAESATPGRSVAVAVVGPLTNLGLALAALSLARATSHGQVANILLVATGWANLIVAGFNALPGLPLDGGRVLEAAVWKVTRDRRRGTLAAAWLGRAVAFGLAGGAVVRTLAGMPATTAVWVLLIAVMLWQGAGASVAAVAWMRRADRVDPRELMRPAVAVPSSSSVESLLLAAQGGRARAVVLLDVYGRPTSVVDEQAASRVAPGRAAQVPASSVGEPLVEGAVVDVRSVGAALIAVLQSLPAPRYAVVDGAERVVGVLEWEDVARFVSAS